MNQFFKTPLCAPILGQSLIKVTGQDAERFLHNQFTQSMMNLSASVRSAGYLSPKGRLLATFRAFRGQDGAFYLVLPTSVQASFLKRIQMFVLRDDVHFEVIDVQGRMAVIIGNDAAAFQAMGLTKQPAVGEVIEVAGWVALGIQPTTTDQLPRTLVIAPDAAARATLPATGGFDDWTASEILAGVASITDQTLDAFVPQQVNYELIDGVNFKKGCYPGQEVVSRVQHIGKVSRRVSILYSDVPVNVGDTIYCGSTQAGVVVNTSNVECGGCVSLVCFTLASLLDGQPCVSPGVEPMTLIDLPYAIRDVLNITRA